MLHSKSTSSKSRKKREYCHCKRTCGALLSKRARWEHYSKILDPSTIEASESEYEPEYDTPDSPSGMELDKPSYSPTHDIPESPHDMDADLSQNQIDNIFMDVDSLNNSASRSASHFEGESDSDSYDNGLDLDELPDADEWKAFDE